MILDRVDHRGRVTKPHTRYRTGPRDRSVRSGVATDWMLPSECRNPCAIVEIKVTIIVVCTLYTQQYENASYARLAVL